MLRNNFSTALPLMAAAFLLSCTTHRVQPSDTVGAQVRYDSSMFNGNPIIRSKFTADPAAMVYKDSVYIYAGRDEAPERHIGYVMNNWLVYSSADMVNWQEHPVPLRATDFPWAKGEAWASHVVQKGGKFYWYATVEHATIRGKAIGVAVADHPTGPFRDAIGKALVTNDMTTDTDIFWDDIDPAVFIDDDGAAYIFWGNTKLRYAKLKANMTELDGPINDIALPHFTEAAYVHKHNGWYYLSYALGFPERTAYAMSRSIHGPWTYKGVLNEWAGNCNTNHQSIIDFKGASYFIYHNGALSADAGSFRRSVCVDYLYYNRDGTLQPVQMTSKGVELVR